jgi:hypothetical protein
MTIYKANDAASPSPVSDGKNVYVFFAELGLISYGPDGKERWRVPLGPFNSFYGMAASPVLSGNTLVMVCDHRNDSFITALDARTGKELWKTSRTNFEGYSTPAIYKPKVGPAQVIVLGSQSVDAYSLDKGTRLWWVSRVGSYPKGVPVVGTDMVYVLAEGADQPFFPPFEETLKKSDKNNDQRIHRDEMKSEPDMVEHFGWLDANRRLHRPRRIRFCPQLDCVGPRTDRRASGRPGRPYVVERRLAHGEGLSKHTCTVDLPWRDVSDERRRDRFECRSCQWEDSETGPYA